MFLFSIVIGILAISLAIGSVSATDQTITNTTDGGLKTAISNASDGDTITLKNGIYYGDNNRGIIINKNLKIVGEAKNKVILDAQKKNRFLEISSGVNVTLVNLTFKNGLITSDEDIWYNQDSNGGAIFNNGNISVKDSTFANNQAVTDKGYSYGGAIYNYGGSFSVSGSTFNNNQAVSDNHFSYGGAIYNYGGSFSVSGSTFTSNKASNYGGAIYSTGSIFSVSGSNFTGNNASWGGAIYNYGGSFSVSGSTFTNNQAKRGGAIYNGDGSFSVSGSNFTGNNASWGGVIYNYGGSFSVSGSIFTNINQADYGGAIYNGGGSFSVSGSIFTNINQADYGGVIYNGGNFSVSGSTFTNSFVAIIENMGNFNVNSSNFTNNSGSHVIDNRGALSVTGSNFINNHVGDNGVICTYGGSIKINKVTFNNNHARYGGGAIYNSIGNCSVSGSTFINNYAKYGGGAISNILGNFSVSGSTFTSNKATNGGGGAILNLAGIVKLNNVSFKNNIVDKYYNKIVTSIYNAISNERHKGILGKIYKTNVLITPKDGISAVAKVSANYKTGKYNKDIKLILTANKGTIYYKIGNGIIKKYTNPITITKTSKISFYAKHSDGNSAVSTYTYTIVKKSTSKKSKISYSVKESYSDSQITRTFTVKNKGSVAGSLSGILKISALKYIKTIASTSAYYKYDKVRNALTLGVKNLGAGKSTTLKVILKR